MFKVTCGNETKEFATFKDALIAGRRAYIRTKVMATVTRVTPGPAPVTEPEKKVRAPRKGRGAGNKA